MSNLTMKYNNDMKDPDKTKEVLVQVYEALLEKGYNPVNQLVGYFISGDPTYITSHKDARALIKHIEIEEILEFLLKYFINNNI